LPVIKPLPSVDTPNREDSSEEQTMISTGCRVWISFSLQYLTISQAPMTPIVPSYLPPSYTVSICDPIDIEGKSSFCPALFAMMLQTESVETDNPSSSNILIKYSLAFLSCSVKANLLIPLPSAEKLLILFKFSSNLFMSTHRAFFL